MKLAVALFASLMVVVSSMELNHLTGGILGQALSQGGHAVPHGEHDQYVGLALNAASNPEGLANGLVKSTVNHGEQGQYFAMGLQAAHNPGGLIKGVLSSINLSGHL